MELNTTFNGKTPLRDIIDYYYPSKDGYRYVVDLPKWNTKTYDYTNSSGIITRYLSEFLNVDVPSDRRKKSFLIKNGLFWYDGLVKIALEPYDKESELWTCPYCGKTIERNRKSVGHILTHLNTEHGISKQEHLKKYSQDRDILTYANETFDLQNETDTTKYITCAVCGKKLRRLDWKHLQKHGLTKEEYIYKYGTETLADTTKDKLRKIIQKVNENPVIHNTSNAEKEIKAFLTSFGIEVYNHRKIVEGKEIDIFIPSLNIGIEYNGIYYHTDRFKDGINYHLDKTVSCRKNGISLIQIFEDEWMYHKDLVLSKIRHLVGRDNTKENVMARKCTVKETTKEECLPFLNKNHIQGYGKGSVKIGAYYNDKLVGVMLLKKLQNGDWELTRFATDVSIRCQGVGGKLFSYFVKKYKPTVVKSFADRRWTVNEQDNLYIRLGFKFDGYTRPDYRYVGKLFNNRVRVHKFRMRKKYLLRMDKQGLLTPDMTEKEMSEKLQMKRIYDCGLIRYLWKG